MKENHFIFADLSTYNVAVAKQFYTDVFGWSFYSEDNYHLALSKNKTICGLYETPQKFKAMNMPSFWMSYIQVNNIQSTVNKAKELGGIVELVDLNLPIGKVALIRDPLGAGFTIYEGHKLNSRYYKIPNAMVWNELFVSDISKIKSFYESLFNWSIKLEENKRYIIENGASKPIGAMQEVSNSVKGNKEYWSVYFSVNSLEDTKKSVMISKGSLLYEDNNMAVFEDPFGAFFHTIPIYKQSESEQQNIEERHVISWKAILGLSLIILSFITSWYWIWGIFFALWVVFDINSGHTYLLEAISKKDSPVLYWIVITLWSILSIYSILHYSELYQVLA